MMNNEAAVSSKQQLRIGHVLIAFLLFFLFLRAIDNYRTDLWMVCRWKESPDFSALSLKELKNLLVGLKLPDTVQRVIEHLFDLDMDWIILFEKMGQRIIEEEGEIPEPPYFSHLRERINLCGGNEGCAGISEEFLRKHKEGHPHSPHNKNRLPLLTAENVMQIKNKLHIQMTMLEHLRPSFDCTSEDIEEWEKLFSGLRSAEEKLLTTSHSSHCYLN
eukprot:TRINITY_DN2795_c0_g1_i1.p1 TRINITY_DN2795_c0_g1~~TRINITY_DN2795_c0_g1_i1.p1  ORF type:complete len:218 (-),score=37.20 TRINITY_DN2795_c0_g1_i1:227-880(-)